MIRKDKRMPSIPVHTIIIDSIEGDGAPIFMPICLVFGGAALQNSEDMLSGCVFELLTPNICSHSRRHGSRNFLTVYPNAMLHGISHGVFVEFTIPVARVVYTLPRCKHVDSITPTDEGGHRIMPIDRPHCEW